MLCDLKAEFRHFWRPVKFKTIDGKRMAKPIGGSMVVVVNRLHLIGEVKPHE
jgi:hypothetical protein